MRTQDQWVAELESSLPVGHRVGRMGAGAGDHLATHDVLVGVVNSAGRSYAADPAGWAVVMAARSTTSRWISGSVGGLSATCARDDDGNQA